MSTLQDIQYNCNISDARDHGIYSMCTMVLKLRNLYKWEHALQPWQEPEPGDLLDWIEKKENHWQLIAEEAFHDIGIDGRTFSPASLTEINALLGQDQLVYGAGYGRSMKSVFFLAEMIQSYRIEGFPVIILGRERAKEMASPFAMVQNGVIIIRREPLRYFLWDQVQELRSSCRSAFQHALFRYGVMDDGTLNQERFRTKLDEIVDGELHLFIYHEVGELLQETLDSATMKIIFETFPGSAIELVCRTIKDVLADTHPRGLLSYCINNERETSLSFYIGFLDGLRKKMLPEIFIAWQQFLTEKNWQTIEDARQQCWEKNQAMAVAVKKIAAVIGDIPDSEVQQQFNLRVLEPLGLDIPA